LFRALAVFLVAWFHLWQQSWRSPGVFEPVVRAGYAWVDAMILLSAFCLFLPYAHARAGGLPFAGCGGFYKKRALRILPGYYLNLAASAAAALARQRENSRGPLQAEGAQPGTAARQGEGLFPGGVLQPGATLPQNAAQLLARKIGTEFAALLPGFAQQGFAALREEYCRLCVNLGREVEFAGGRGIARDIDGQGRLLVETEAGGAAVFTGEVSVQGIYGEV